MRKLAVVVAAALALVASLLVMPAAWAGHATKSIVVIAKMTSFKWEAHGTEGPEGDKVALAFDLYDTNLQSAGDGAGGCQLTAVDHAAHQFTASCHAFFNIEGGKIEASGEVTHGAGMDGTAVADITGGTGKFTDAKGTVTVAPLLGSPADAGAQAAHGMGEGEDGGHGGHGHGHLAKVTFDFS